MSEPAWVPLGAAPVDTGPEVAYAEFTGTVAISATTEAGANVVVTAPSFVADGSSQYLVEFFAPLLAPNASGGSITYLTLFMDGVSLGRVASAAAWSGAGSAPVRTASRLTPAAGPHTFSIRAFASLTANSPSVAGAAGGSGLLVPGFIRITKVPSASPGLGALVPPTLLLTSLPASPVDGQECVLTDSLTAGTFFWHLRYVAGRASNKWVFVGGAPRLSEVPAAEATSSTAYAALATAGPSIVIPVVGDYQVDLGFSNQASTQLSTFMSYDIGGTAAADADAAQTRIDAAPRQVSGVRSKVKSALPAVTLTAKYRVDAGTGTLLYRYMRVTPIAIGG